MERPTSVEVGSRWTNGTGDFGTVVRLEGHIAIMRWDTGDETDPTQAMVLAVLTYLGGPSQPQVAAGQRREWTIGRPGPFTLEAHPRFPGQFQRRDEHGDCGGIPFTAEEVERGSTLLAPGEVLPAANVVVDRSLHTDKRPAEPPRYNIAAGAEMRYSNGHPRTALEAIRARQKPEPWRPSVDEVDLLPDVDVRR